MLPRPHRLLKKDFAPIRRAAFSVRGSFMMLRVFRGSEALRVRAGIIVPKKLIAKATARNRVRRRIRHVLSTLLPHLPPGTLLLILVRGGIDSRMAPALRTELSSLLRRAQLLP